MSEDKKLQTLSEFLHSMPCFCILLFTLPESYTLLPVPLDSIIFCHCQAQLSSLKIRQDVIVMA